MKTRSAKKRYGVGGNTNIMSMSVTNGMNLSNGILIIGSLTTIRRWSIPVLFLAIIVLFCYQVCLKIGIFNYFIFILSKTSFALGSRALCLLLVKLTGCSGGMALLVCSACKALIHWDEMVLSQLILLMENPHAGSPEAGPSNQASSSSTLTLQEAIQNKKEAIRALIIDKIVLYLDAYENEIRYEFPRVGNEIGTSRFIENFTKMVVSDYGFEDPSHSLPSLRTFHRVIKDDLSFLENEPSYNNNVLYSNLRVLLKDQR